MPAPDPAGPGDDDVPVVPGGLLDLDDPDALAAADPAGVLPALASAAAQVRATAHGLRDAGTDAALAGPRPRAVVCLAVDPAGAAAVAALVTLTATNPVAPVLDSGGDLPAWVGAGDAVLVLSTDGRDPRLTAAADLALRRGARTLALGPPGSPLLLRVAQGRGAAVPLPPPPLPAGGLWPALTAAVGAAAALGLLVAPPDELAALATAVQDEAVSCGALRAALTNPAKHLAAALHPGPVLALAATAPAVLAARVVAAAAAAGAGVPVAVVDLRLGGAGAGLLTGADGAGGTGSGPGLFYDPDLDGPRAARPTVVEVLGGVPDPVTGDVVRTVRAVAAAHGWPVRTLGGAAADSPAGSGPAGPGPGGRGADDPGVALSALGRLLARAQWTAAYLQLLSRPGLAPAAAAFAD